MGIRRIAINVFAVYGRSIIAILCGIFASRWLLMSLGEVDYGLYGVVAGLVGFAAIFHQMLSAGTVRYYALGENVQAWFSTSFLLHVLLAVLLLATGYPLGVYAIRNWLTIPAERLEACKIVFTLASVGCVVSMFAVPFSALWTARQKIAELSICGYAQTILNVGFLYFVVTHPGDWLVGYAAWILLLGVATQGVVAVVTLRRCPECRFGIDRRDFFARAKRLLTYSWWQLFGNLGVVAQSQGVAILVNRGFGPRVNAGLSVANAAGMHVQGLAGSLQNAYEPIIIASFGENNPDGAFESGYRVCRLGTLMVLLFAIPLYLESRFALHLWLGNPPMWAEILLGFILLALVLDKLSVGHMLVVNASGKVALYQSVLGILATFALPVLWLCISHGASPMAVGMVLVSFAGAKTLGRVLLAKCLLGMGLRRWLLGVAVPIAMVACCSFLAGLAAKLFMPEGIVRSMTAAVASMAVLMPLSWFVVLDGSERETLKRGFVRLWR